MLGAALLAGAAVETGNGETAGLAVTAGCGAGLIWAGKVLLDVAAYLRRLTATIETLEHAVTRLNDRLDANKSG